jgi:hypothetical protein
MSTWYLLNDVVTSPAQRHLAGEFVDDSKTGTAGILAAGGVLWPSSDAVVAAAAALVQAYRRRGSAGDFSTLMVAAATRSLSGEAGGAVTSVTGAAPISSTGGTTPALSISPATDSAAGSMSAADKTKLDGLTGTAAGTAYSPGVPGNWVAPPPTTVQQALDRIAANTTSTFPIP